MPALRLPNRRRKSSHNITYTPAKPGIYGVPSRPSTSTAVTFAPNVTPISYSTPDADADDDPLNPLAALEDDDAAAGPHVKALRAQIFPDSVSVEANATGQQKQKRKRTPPGKRPSQGYIPRPPNAFMLFRAAFVKQRHVPGSFETNHGSLSKIIGNCWRQLPLEEKKIWEKRAKEEKAAHKVRFPDYRFRPVHNKNKGSSAPPSTKSSAKADGRTKERQPTTAEEEQRCEDISTLILEGKAGDELEAAIRDLDRARVLEKERLVLARDVRDAYSYDFDVDGSESQRSRSRRTSLDFTSRHASPAALHLPYSIPSNPGFVHPFAHSSNSAVHHRRSSSVPLPNDWFASSGPFLGSSSSGSGIALPTLPALSSLSRAPSPSPMGVGSVPISRFAFAHAHAHSQSVSVSGFQAAQEQFFQHQNESTFNFAQQTPQTQLFHPAPQTPISTFLQSQMTPRSSFGLGLGMGMGMGTGMNMNMRRASSAQATLMRSWTMPVDLDSFNYGLSLGMDVDMGIDMGMGMDAGHRGQMAMERDPSPLPDIESGLFADFSFGSTSSYSTSSSPYTTASSTLEHQRSASASLSTSAPTPVLAPIDTSISPLDSEQPSASTTTTSASTSASGSPAPSASDILPEISSINMGMGMGIGMGPLDCLYPSMAMDSMGVYDQDQYAPMGMGMEMEMGMYEYEIDPVVSHPQHEHENVHSPKPMRTPTAMATEAGFAELAGGDGGY